MHVLEQIDLDRDWLAAFADITRREFVIAGASALALVAVGCGDDQGAETSAATTWDFVDDRGERIERPSQPERLVVYEAFLPAFWEAGLRPIGVLASMPIADNPDIAPVAERLGIPLKDVQELSTIYGEVNLEQMASLDPDLIVTYFNERTEVLYGFADEPMQERAAELAPPLALDIHNDVPTDLRRVLELAAALGGDVKDPGLKEDQKEFDEASDRLRRIAAEREGMTVLAALPLPDGVFVAAPSIYTFTAYLQSLGFDVVVPADDTATVSWELVPTDLAADAVLLALGADYPTNDELLESQPTWRAHPGVAADQVASVFPNVIVPSYASVTAILNSCADALEGFRPLG